MMMIPWGISSHHLTSNDDIEKFPTNNTNHAQISMSL